MDIELNLDNGKYTYVLKDDKQYALRHGEEWRDLVGDKLVLCLAFELDEAKQRITELERALTKNHMLIEADVYDDIASSYAMDGDPLCDEYKEMAEDLRREVEAKEKE